MKMASVDFHSNELCKPSNASHMGGALLPSPSRDIAGFGVQRSARYGLMNLDELHQLSVIAQEAERGLWGAGWRKARSG